MKRNLKAIGITLLILFIMGLFCVILVNWPVVLAIVLAIVILCGLFNAIRNNLED